MPAKGYMFKMLDENSPDQVVYRICVCLQINVF